jgi:hypothetical protein
MGDENNCGPKDGCNKPKCPECAMRKAEAVKTEELNLAILIALVPVMTFSFFNLAGLL